MKTVITLSKYLHCARTALFLTLVFSMLGVEVHAQVDQGTITGVVTDTTGAAIPGATIDLVNTDTGFELHALTDGSGVYAFPPLKVGHYNITGSAVGFSSTTVHAVEVQVNQRLGLNLQLKVGTATQRVEVSADSEPLLQTQDASNAQEISSKTLNETPLNGRNYVFIAQLTAGVAPAADGRGDANGDFDANGQRPEQNNFILDGVDNNDSSADLLNSTSYTVKPPPDALSEFKIQTISYDAQLGHSAGAVVNAAIKSGTNALHGNLWEYLRNDALDAREFGALTIPEYRQNQFGGTIGGPIVKNHLFFFADTEATRIVYGNPAHETVPTALMRTGNFSELLQPALTGEPAPVKLYVPGTGGTTLQACNGQQNVFCPGQISSIAQNILSLYPTANTNGADTYSNYTANLNSTDNVVQWDGKIDWSIREKDQAFVRFSYSNSRGETPPPLGPILDGGSFGGGNLASKVEGVSLSETHMFTPKFSNEFRIGENLQVINHTQANENTDLAASLGLGGIPFGPQNGGLPAGLVSGISGFGSAFFYPAIQHDNTTQLLDNATRILGNHSVRFGLTLERVRYSYLEVFAPRGAYSYSGQYTGQPGTSFTGSGVADFIVDYQNSAFVSEVSNVDHLHWYGAGYVQDDWIVKPRLTVNLGLRYDYYQPYLEIRDRQANFVPTSTSLGTGTGTFLLPNKWKSLTLAQTFNAAAQADNVTIAYTGNRSLSSAAKTNFSPRIGIVFQPTSKWVIRTGYGMFYGGLESTGGSIGQQYPFENTSFYAAESCVPGSCPTDGIALNVGFGNVGTPTPQSPVFLPELIGKPLHYRDTYSEQWNFMNQYALNRNLSITAGYVGSVGRHQQVFTNPNASEALAYPGTNTYGYQAFPSFGSMTYNSYAGTSGYNGLQASLEQRLHSGLMFLASYTYSHSLDTGSSLLGTSEFRNTVLIPLKYEVANSPFDVRHRVTLNGSYEIPVGRGRKYANSSRALDAIIGGWSTSLTFAAQTGNPITVTPNITTATGGTAFAFRVGDPFKGGGQPNSTNPDITCPAKVRTVTHWFNPCAFANPLPGNQISGLITNKEAAIQYLGPARNQTFGPGYNNINMSLFKRVPIVEKQYLEFRVDAFDLFNTAAWGNPSDVSVNSTSGYILTGRSLGAYTPDGRFLQVALKYYF